MFNLFKIGKMVSDVWNKFCELFFLVINLCLVNKVRVFVFLKFNFIYEEIVNNYF